MLLIRRPHSSLRLFWESVQEQAAGLGILVLKEFLGKWSGDKKPQADASDDLFIVTIFHPSGFRLILCDLYLRPLQKYSVWRAAKESLQNLRPLLRRAAIPVAGDLNQDISRGTGRFASSLNKTGTLASSWSRMPWAARRTFRAIEAGFPTGR